ncbi:hypothetical protein LOTGIDRAFT_152660 [Lottia gigantea]|uniref:IGFBP N-terminal domain-containing protein n=1 Tax=Lottia gigantea TaxID=225164 RepID=V4ARU5_LOTGI|nr:hypothetical protein LOTGIDRAFT_152660 [Lottia gigantea]ESO97570.1 hypothetical protein LOTGIDRAFT_152660 [Lottia gigantea]
MASMIKLSILCSMIATVTSLSCVACPKDQVCDPLPESAECFPAKAACACCKTCAGRFGDKCSTLSVRCHPDFVCVNEDGVELSSVPWYTFDFRGICVRDRCPEPSTGGDGGIVPLPVGK